MILIILSSLLGCIAFLLILHFVQKGLVEKFKALSFDVMEKNSKVFLELAKTSLEKYTEGAKSDLEARQKAIDGVILPMKETIAKLEASQLAIEKDRAGAYHSLLKELGHVRETQKNLQEETHHLVQALRSPNVRGSWGQIHLRRVVELAGLLNHCDFLEEKTVSHEGRSIRPDLVVHLPGDREIVIDAKTPMDAYLHAADEVDEKLKKKKLLEHANHLRRHMRELSSKEYWRQFKMAPEYVILFLPAEAFFSAALQVDPSLIEVGADQNVIMATPTTLIAILRAVAFSWKQEGLSQRADEIARLGQEFYERIQVVLEHWTKVGKHLTGSVDAYNQAVASMESRVLVTAKKLRASASIPKESLSLEPIEKLLHSPKIDI